MAGRALASNDTPMAEINVTPLVDVMLVLLVIFIVMAPLFAQALRVDLPQAEAPPLAEPRILDVELMRSGSCTSIIDRSKRLNFPPGSGRP